VRATTPKGKSGDSWRTPDWLHSALDPEFGFDLDPCPFQPEWAATIHQNGLELNWDNHKVYCNPPYSNILPWVEKAYVSNALTVFLLPSYTSNEWFHILKDRSAEIRFFRKRVGFITLSPIAPRAIRTSV
jgi:phage N-6-adenine-methyltransferase